MLPPFYADFLRENLYTSLYWRQLGTLVTIPKGHGTKARISNWSPTILPRSAGMSATALTAISSWPEGTIAVTKEISAASITGYITSYEGAVGYTQKNLMVSMANVTEGALETLGRELAWRIDSYHRRQCSGNAWSVQALCAVGTGAAPAAGALTQMCRLHSKTLAMVGPKFGTLGVPRWADGTYVGIAHEVAQYDMMMDTSAHGYVPIARYNDARKIYRGEIGEFYGVRWLLSPTSVLRHMGVGSLSATTGISAGVTGSNAFVFSPDSFYCLELENGGVEVINQPLGSAGIADPKLGSIGVNVYFGTIPTPSADKRMMKLNHACSLNF
jgi:N4-gp56 family major capsid protein